MVKSVMITLTNEISQTALNKTAKLIVGTTTYPGTITAIVTH